MKIRFVRRSGNCLRLGLALWRYKGRPLAFLVQVGTWELQFNCPFPRRPETTR